MPTPACGPFLLALLLAACSQSTKPSANEDEQLNNAAEMLDSAPDRLTGIDDRPPEPPRPPEPRNTD